MPHAENEEAVDKLRPHREGGRTAPGGGIPALDAIGAEDDEGFGVLDMGLPGAGVPDAGAAHPSGPADLPMPAVDADLPMAIDEPGLPMAAAEAELPMAIDAALPMPAMEADLPMTAERADLPMAAERADLPMAAGHADLPMAIDADLPMAAQQTDLPMAAQHADLPVPAHQADLPMVAGDADLPLPIDADLPMPAHGTDLPMPAHGTDLPMPALHGDLPVPADQDLPLPAPGGDLPLPADQDLPMPSPDGDLPLPGDYNLPAAAPNGDLPLPSEDAATQAMARGAGLPPPQGDQARRDQAFLADGLFPTEPGSLPPPEEFGQLDDDEPAMPPRREGAGVGDEFAVDEVEEGPSALMEAPIPDSEGLAEGEQAPKVKLKRKRGNALRVALVLIPVLAIGGGLLGLTEHGPYGYYSISDSLNKDTYKAGLASFRQSAQDQLAIDTAAEAAALFSRARGQQSNMNRYVPMTGYTAYLAFLKIVRFGPDSQVMAIGKQLLDGLEEPPPGNMLSLGKAARLAAEGNHAAAQSQLAQLSTKMPDNIDVIVLEAEVALASNNHKEALGSWKRAVKLKKNARTLFGLARAQQASGADEEANKSAHETLKLSKNHAGARALIATQLWQQNTKSKQALEMLEQITAKGAVREAASTGELVIAYSLLGNIQLSQSHLTDAEKAFAAALKLDPRSEHALTGNGELFFVAGRYSEALASFDAAFRVNKGNMTAITGKAKAMIALERAKEAKDELTKLMKTSKHPLIGYWLGKAEEALGKRDEAEKAYQHAIKVGSDKPEVVMAYVALAELLGARGNQEGANKALADASAKMPNNPALHTAKGDVALSAGRLDDAKKEFQAALALEADNSLARFKLGVAHRRAREFTVATKQYDLVAQTDPEFPGLALERGLLFEETGKTDKALEMYKKALEKAPEDIDLKLRVGSTLVISGQAKTALPILQDVLQKRPNSAEVNHFIGRAKLVLGLEIPEALRHLQQAVQQDPNRAVYHLYVAWAANLAGQPAVAEEAIEKTIKLDKTLGDGYWQRGVFLQKSGQTRDALKALGIALEKNPSRFEAYATIALCHQDQADYGAAETAWRKAIAGNGDVAEWQFRLGKILIDRGARDEAAPHLRKAIDIALERKLKPGWLWQANFHLGDVLRKSDPNRARQAIKEFLRLTTSENAYRADAEAWLKELGDDE